MTCAAPGTAWAQDEARASARVAAQAGLKAFSEGHYSQAADLLERAESVYHAPTHLLYLARTYEKLGKFVKARETYLKLVQEQLAADAAKAFISAKADGAKELAALEPRLAYVTIQLTGAQPGAGLRLMVDGNAVPAALAGIPRPTDPGSHAYQAFAEGMQSTQVTLMSKEGTRESVSLSLERVPGAVLSSTEPGRPGGGHSGGAAAGGAAAGATSTAAPTSTNPLATDYPESSSSGSGVRTVGFISLGLGAVGLGVGAYFLVTGLGKQSDADRMFENCKQTNSCTPLKAEIEALDDDAVSKLRIGGAVLAVGGAGVIAGITMIALGGSKSTAARQPAVTPWFGLTSVGLSGTF